MVTQGPEHPVNLEGYAQGPLAMDAGSESGVAGPLTVLVGQAALNVQAQIHRACSAVFLAARGKMDAKQAEVVVTSAIFLAVESGVKAAHADGRRFMAAQIHAARIAAAAGGARN